MSDYTKLLAVMKRQGIKVEDLPEDLAQSLLKLHQNELDNFVRRPRKKQSSQNNESEDD